MVAITLNNISKNFSQNSLTKVPNFFASKTVAPKKGFYIENLNLVVPSKSFFFLLGPSGCGKSTILRIIAGLESVDSGTVLFDDVDVTSKPVQERDIGFVFQNYALWPHLTVKENIKLGLDNKNLSLAETLERIESVSELLKLKDLLQRKPHQLSGGQQQRVALARSLVLKPKVILFDEPLSNLDTRLKEDVLAELRNIHTTTEATFVYVTHDYNEAISIGTQMAIMENGKIVQCDSPLDIYNKPKNEFIANFIGDINIIDFVGDKRFGIRPEMVKIVQGNDVSKSNDSCYEFKISEKKFKEGFFKLLVTDQKNNKLKITVDFVSGEKLSIGDRVLVAFNNSSIINF